MADCIVYLVAGEHDSSPRKIIETLTDASSVLIKGIVHGWVHEPHLSREHLLGHKWNLFVLAEKEVNFDTIPGVEAYMMVNVSIPTDQYNSIRANIGEKPQPATTTPPLPDIWISQSNGDKFKIPQEHVLQSKSTRGVGELRLGSHFATFLSTALPDTVKDAPVSLFNLFRYKGGDRTVHDSYMEGFKRNFGDSAGAQVKFMGPYRGSELRGTKTSQKVDQGQWQDANLVQYDSIWHYAYMLSTQIYKELNKEKVAGLDDTCILLVSEMELV